MRPTHRAVAASLLLAAALAGCGNSLMPTPVGFDGAGADPFAQTAVPDRGATVRLFLATNRSVRAHAEGPSTHFGNDRAEPLRLGTLDVRIGDDGLGWPDLCELSRRDGRDGTPPVRIEAIDDFGPVWTSAAELRTGSAEGGIDAAVRDRFAAAVERQLQDGGLDEMFVFVHGFNTDIEGNAAVGASLFHYLGRRGALVQFEWPSRDSVWSYQADKAAAAASVRTFRHLLARLGSGNRVRKVHVIAHSAGAPIALGAIHELRLMRSADPAPAVREALRLGRLVLVAPDMDLGEFRDCVADGATEVPERTTIYVSSRDKALDFSAWMAGFARLGQPLQMLTPRQVEFLEDDANVDIVDVVAAESRLGSWLGHSYFHEDPWVSTDVLLTLSSGAHPLDRGLQRDGTRKVYAFGTTYPERAREAARRIQGGAPGDTAPPPGGTPATEVPEP
jgi:esterase/lipase superfamily enzyme